MIETKIGVDGMMCAMCEAHVAGAVRDALGKQCVKATASRKSRCSPRSPSPSRSSAMP